MVSQHIINIILKAEDQISKTVEKVKKEMDDMGNTSKQSMSKSTQASNQFRNSLSYSEKALREMDMSLLQSGKIGKTAFNNLTQAQKQALMSTKSYGQTVTNVYTAIANKTRIVGIGASEAANRLHQMKLDPSLGSNLDRARLKISQMGVDISSTRGKIMVLGTAVRTGLGSTWDIVKTKVHSVASSIRSRLGSAIDSVKSKVTGLGNSFQTMGGMIASAVGAMGVNSIKDLTVGLSLSREKMSSLNTAIMGSKTASDSLLNSLDTMTNTSVVGMDAMVNALNKIKLSTSMSNEQLNGTKEAVMKLGEASILMGNDTATAAYQMGEAYSGLNGDFQILKENFGITKEKMKAMGWSGEASDVEGYTKALNKCLGGLGDLGGVMDTTSGSIEMLKKRFRVAGRQIGDELTPYIKKACDAFLELDRTTPGLTKGIIAVGGAIAGFATVAPYINDFAKPMSDAVFSIKTLGGAAKDVGRYIKDGFAAARTAVDLLTGATTLNTLAEEGNAFAAGLLSVKTSLLAAKNFVAAVATGDLATANAILNASFLASPITWVVAGLVALAVAVYEVGKYFGWWKDIPTMFEAMTAGIKRLWSAFINNPDVQGLIKGISDAFTWLCDVIKPVTSAFSNVFPKSATGEFDIVRAIIDAVGYSFNVLKGILLAITIPAQAVIEVFTQIIEILSPVLIPVLELMGQVLIEMVSGLLQIIDLFAQFGEGQITLSELLTGIWTILLDTFTLILTTIVTTIAGWIIQIATMALQAGMNFVYGIISWISQLPGRVFAWIIATASRIAAGTSRWVSIGRSRASSMVSAVISFISQLPGRVASFISSTAGRIASGAGAWISNARSKAAGVVSAVVGQVSQLPGKVYTEFMNIGSRIMSAGSDLVNKARQIGQNIVNGMLNAMHIHSPGIIQKKVVKEFEDTLANVADMTNQAEKAGANVGESLVSSYSNFELPTQTLNVEANTTQSTNTDSDDGDEKAQEEVANQDQTLASMVANVNQKYNQMKSLAGIDLSQLQLMNTQAFTNIRANEMAQMNLMANHINSSLLKIINYTQTGLLQTSNITKDNLNKMQNSTSKITKEMVKAWNSMKNSIVSAAKNIKNEATTHFNTLSSTIGGFYRKLQNPNLWGAGPSSSGMMQRNRVVGRASSGGASSGMSIMSSILANSIRREKNIPHYITPLQAQSIPCLTAGNIEYNTSNGKIDTTSLIRSGALSGICLDCVSGAGAWENTAPPNIKKIKDTTNNWSMKGPAIHTGAGNIQTGLAFKVKDFASGTPNISFSAFKQIGAALFAPGSGIPYDHYCDSEKYGSWQNAIAAGRCNCSDGADALLALARTCGFSGEKVHCYWDGEGHFCTRINGEILDTTAMQQRGMWVSSAVTGYGSGPAPKRVGRQTVARSSGFTENNEENTHDNGEFTLKGEITVNHTFEGLPENVDEDTIVRMIRETTDSDSWIKNLANNIRFQLEDAKAKTRLERKANRSRGIT